MHDMRLGRIHEDFWDSTSFSEFWASPKVESAFSKLRSVPDAQCNSCVALGRCGGGCLSNWFNYSFDDIREHLNESFQAAASNSR